MIDTKEVEEILEESYLDNAQANLYLFENKKTRQDPLSVYELNIDRDIIQQIRALSKEYLSSILKTIEANSLSEIPAYKPDKEQDIFKIDSQDVEIFNELYKYIVGEKSRVEYKKDKVKDEKLKAWIFRFETEIDGNIEQILFFQRFQPSKMLGSHGITIFEHEQRFKLLGDNILHFNLGMDLMFYRGTLLVTKTASFENIFDYEEYYKNKATSLVRELSAHKMNGPDYTLRIIDIGAVKNEINMHTRLAHKLYSSRKNSYFKKINYDKLVGLNQKHKLGLKLDSAKHEWIIDEDLDLQVMAQILNDDYELSQLTDNEYIASAKEKIPPNKRIPR